MRGWSRRGARRTSLSMRILWFLYVLRASSVRPAGATPRGAGTHAPVNASWLERSAVGYCAETESQPSPGVPLSDYIDCRSKAKGSFALGPAQSANWTTASRACLALCRGCENCRYVSVSPSQRDCSWFARCDLQALRNNVQGFRSAALRGAHFAHPRTREPHNAYVITMAAGTAGEADKSKFAK